MEGVAGLPELEVQRMRLLRRLVIAAALVVGPFIAAAPAGASTLTATTISTPMQVAAVGGMQVLAQQAPVVDVTPSSDGMPGADLIQKLLSWLSQLALWGSLASILAGATVYGLAQNSANYNGAYRGKQLAVAGAIGAALAGLAPTAITMLFQAAGG